MISINSRGQTILELIVVIAVGIIIVGALTFATIASLRNAQFSKNQSQATKIAQEGIEKVKTIRDRDGTVRFNYGEFNTTQKFSDLWTISGNMQSTCNPCYFLLTSDNGLQDTTATSFETVGDELQRQIVISEEMSPDQEKKITVVVRWSDFSGTHQSKLTTILRRL